MKDFNMVNFLDKLKEESKVLKNYAFIMQKSEKDGYLKIFFDSLKYVFQNELKYTISELNKMKKLEKDLNIKKMIETNLYIFKENIKIILNNCVDQVWGFYMKEEFLDKLINDDNQKSELVLITELDEENEITEKTSVFDKSERVINGSIYISDDDVNKSCHSNSIEKTNPKKVMKIKNYKGFKSLEQLKIDKTKKFDTFDILKINSNIEIYGGKHK